MTTETRDFYFGLPETNPREGLEDAASVLDALGVFISNMPSLDGFERNAMNRTMHGLHVIIESTKNAVLAAAEDMARELSEANELALASNDDDTAGTTYPKVASLGQEARKMAVAESVRKGYPSGAIAWALSLKKRHVEKIISELRATGVIPENDEDSGGQAATA